MRYRTTVWRSQDIADLMMLPRTECGSSGHVVATRGVMLPSPDDRCGLFHAVRELDRFNPEDDPYGEHDFGALAFKDVRYFRKIDYYDLDLRYASPDPADPAFTVRVMTIMQTGEY